MVTDWSDIRPDSWLFKVSGIHPDYSARYPVSRISGTSLIKTVFCDFFVNPAPQHIPIQIKTLKFGKFCFRLKD
jgi:hypothetical protein